MRVAGNSYFSWWSVFNAGLVFPLSWRNIFSQPAIHSYESFFFFVSRFVARGILTLLALISVTHLEALQCERQTRLLSGGSELKEGPQKMANYFGTQQKLCWTTLYSLIATFKMLQWCIWYLTFILLLVLCYYFSPGRKTRASSSLWHWGW